MTLESQWYASIMYWLPLRDHIGKQPMLSVKSLLMGSVQIYISLDGGAGKPGGGLTGAGGTFGLVDRMPCRTCDRWSLMISSLEGQYLEALA